MGKNKENDELPQINLLLVFGEKSELPFYYRKLAGKLDVIECFEDEGHSLRIGELLEKQMDIYKALGVTLPTSSC